MKYLVILLSSAHIPHIKWTNNIQSAVIKGVILKNSMNIPPTLYILQLGISQTHRLKSEFLMEKYTIFLRMAAHMDFICCK